MAKQQLEEVEAAVKPPLAVPKPSVGDFTDFAAIFRHVLTDKRDSSFFRRVVGLMPSWISPNAVTVSRTLLIVPIVLAGLNGWFAAALILFLFSMLLDALDGALAQIRDHKTTFGAILDPISDKIVVCGTLLVVLPALPDAFTWPVIATCLLAIGITAARFAKLRAPEAARHGAVAARFVGKFKAVIETLAISLILLGLAVSSSVVVWIGGAGLAISLVLAALSFLSKLKQ